MSWKFSLFFFLVLGEEYQTYENQHPDPHCQASEYLAHHRGVTLNGCKYRCDEHVGCTTGIYDYNYEECTLCDLSERETLYFYSRMVTTVHKGEKVERDYYTEGLDLIAPSRTYLSHNGKLDVTLDFDWLHYGGRYSMNVRSWNGEIPGPTLRVRRGDIITLTLNNRLGKELGNRGHNEFQEPNCTNIHTHGLHISPLSPGDNVFTEVCAGESYTYTYEIPDWHQGGTHWYHPHFHGSSSLQVAGGAGGVIIVEDEPGDVPYPIAEMEEVIIIAHHMFLSFYDQVATASEDKLFKYPDAIDDADYFTLNGMYHPVINLEDGVYKRFRIVNAGFSYRSGLRLTFENPYVNCDIAVLAKDGVYLRKYPRYVQEIVLGAGQRVDIAVRCITLGKHNIISLPPPGLNTVWKGLLCTLNVYSGRNNNAPLIPEYYDQADFFLPWYLQDLVNAQPQDYFDLTLKAVGAITDPNSFFYINDQMFVDDEHYIHVMKERTIQEWRVSGINEHPLHIHINHFQIIEFPSGFESNYFRIGDWQDTANTLEPPGVAEEMIIRFHVVDFIGPCVLHCHILPHEDRGMMAVVNITENYDDPQPPSSTQPPWDGEPSWMVYPEALPNPVCSEREDLGTWNGVASRYDCQNQCEIYQSQNCDVAVHNSKEETCQLCNLEGREDINLYYSPGYDTMFVRYE
eukprot:Lithocolla_globosa_v1_NODE_23_length_9337_cov_35.312756.p2 type:complete len:684 gc:universal NODE_23_length_9337_cov_35.312756:2147-96(-)